MKKYKIHNKHFKNKSEITDFYQKILNRKEKKVINEDFKYVCELLKHHTNYKEKRGSGIIKIQRERHLDFYTKRESKYPHFQIYREDGTNIDFSYIKCIRNIKSAGKIEDKEYSIREVLAAFRFVIRPQINSFRNKTFGNKTYLKCDILNINFSKKTCHIDHIKSFNLIVKDFIDLYSLTIKDIEIKEINGIYNTIKNEDIKNKWFEYHLENAKLRAVHRAGNLSLSKVRVKW